MKKLIKGIINFRKNLNKEKKDFFEKLSVEQKPDALFITCSDSRIVPNLFASKDPGDLFVLRNVGNLIPPISSNKENSAAAALEFSVLSLKISNIIVCGHSECGAMQALVKGMDSLPCPSLKSWLKYAKKSLKNKSKLIVDPSLSEHNYVSQWNVLQQIEHIKSYPFISDRLKTNQIHLHGWWFDIAKADIYCYEKDINQFVLMDEKKAHLILKNLS